MSRSIADVEHNFLPGGDFFGYRYATTSEVIGLFAAAGFGLGAWYDDPARYAQVAALQALIGITIPDRPPHAEDATFGFYDDGVGDPALFGNALLDTFIRDGLNSAALLTPDAVARGGPAQTGMGSLLVRAAPAVVPSPSTIVLLLAALASFLLSTPRLQRRPQYR